MKRICALVPFLLALTVAACGGQSKQDKASAQVCDARSSIAKQVQTLSGLTPSTATLGQIQTSLKTIGDDLAQIASAQGDLNPQRKSQVEQANQQFTSQVKSIASGLGSTTSLNEAKSQLTTALQQLATSYEKTLGPIDCSS